LVAPRFFHDDLAQRLAARLGDRSFYPGILTHGGAATADNSARTAGVQIAAISADWLKVPTGGCLINGELASSLANPKPNDSLLLSLPILNASPLDATLSLRSREDVTSNLRANVTGLSSSPGVASMFNLAGGQRLPRNAWVNLADLQTAVDQQSKANAIFVHSGSSDTQGAQQLEAALRAAVSLNDYGISVSKAAETDTTVITTADTYFLKPVVDAAENAAAESKTQLVQVASYLANTVTDSAGQPRSIHYAMVAGISSVDGQSLADDQIAINQWTADHLHARLGDAIHLTYYVRDRLGGTRELESPVTFKVARILPMTGLGADPTLTPTFKGLTDSDSVSDWRAPAGITIRKEWVTSDDEAYWKKYRAAPKLLVSLATAKKLWSGPYGDVTSFRVPTGNASSFESAFRSAIDPASMGLSFRAIKAEQLAATSGSTDFSGLFIGFSLFLIAAAVLLVAMLFRLNVEQRAPQLGLLAAIGFRAKSLRRMALVEGLLLAVVGAAIGTAAAIGYTALMMLGLRTWWVGAVGTTSMTLHVEPMTLVYGFVGSVIVAGLAILWSVWRVGKTPAATLLAGGWGTITVSTKRPRWLAWLGWLCVIGGAAMLTMESNAEMVLSGGAVILCGALILIGNNLRPSRQMSVRQTPASMGLRNISRHVTRSVVTMSLIALATFALVIVASMRGQAGEDVADAKSGAGGFRLLLTADVPLTGNLNTKQGRSTLGVREPDDPIWSKATFIGLRKWSGEDISCLNLMKPGSPTILSVPHTLVERNGFTFARSIKTTDNKWQLLEGSLDDSVPVIADDETAQYILHLGLGQTLSVNDQTGTPRKLRLVATLAGSVFQGELLMGESNFARLFPSQGGTSQVLVETDAANAAPITKLLNDELADFSVSVDPTADVLAQYQNVKNTYMATFEALGSLGLLLGTIGLAVVLLRGVVERKAELAMLAALGFRRAARLRMVLAENAMLLVVGLVVGAACAVAGTLPVILHSARRLHLAQLGLALAGILIAGLVVLLIAVWFGGRRIGPADLRSE
jgi:ABC-type antimicrobial peptide transport system permease subunit